MTKELTCKHIKMIFPWERLTPNIARIIRFGLKAGEDTYWLDINEDESVPYYSNATVYIKIG